MGLFRASGVTEQGPIRPTNEDCFTLDDSHGLCVVADGLGGHNAGEVASRVAVDAVAEFVRGRSRTAGWPFGFDAALSPTTNLLRTAVHMANARVLEAAGASLNLVGMGTTIVAALVRGQTIAVAHVGDSRLYLFANGALRLLTRDDCWALNRHVLTNVLGTRQQVDVHVVEAPLAGGEIAVLTTDGIHATIDDACIGRLVAAGGEPSDIAERLVKKAVGSGSRDNCTAVVGRC